MRLLVVEDDPMVRDINEKFARKIEAVDTVMSVGTLDEAKALLVEQPVDIVLLDVYFPTGKGTDLLKWIREEDIHCDIVLITADNSVETVETAFRLGAVDYLIKPFTYERFSGAIMKAANRRKQFMSNERLDQDTLDSYMMNKENNGGKRVQNEVMKGVNPKTYERILDEIKTREGQFTAFEIADSIGLARVTIRRYLEFMLEEGVLTVELSYGKVGRPLRLFQYNRAGK